MAITTLYFSTTGNGAADGTSWANRAALFSAGNWATQITGHDFSTNTLVCRIGPGTYTCSQNLSTTVITTDPTVAHPLLLVGCDSSGVMLVPPDPDWVSAMPKWSDSTLPVIATTTNISTITLATCSAYMLKFTASGRLGVAINSMLALLWCHIESTTNNSAAVTVTNTTRVLNCVLTCTGAAYDYVTAPVDMENCRIEGNAGSSGDRRGCEFSSTTTYLSACTVVNNGGEGIVVTSVSAGAAARVSYCTIANNAGRGIYAASTGSQTDTYSTHHCLITGNGTAGVDGNSAAARWIVSDSRFRDNTTDITGLGDYPTDWNNYTTDSDDATEYVSTGANGDFRIKNTAASVWGKGYGAGEEAPASGGAGGNANIFSGSVIR